MEALIRFGYDVFGMDKTAAVVIVLFITVFKIIKTRIDRHKEDKKGKISELLAEVEKNSKPRYHLVIEQVFQNRFGVLIDYPVIKFLTKTKTPSSNVIDYILGRKYLKFNDDYTEISYINKYGSKWLKLVKFIYLTAYYVVGSAGFLMIWQMPERPLSGHVGVSMYLFTIASLLFIAYMCIEESVKPQAAIDLMNKHNKAFKSDS
ncbi:hypothetical protein NI385_17925 [Vibrio parahaemolyticus]|uniref:hypothetical protein n=4 Tax=Vibrionales TaxID=135623 RepID=UPI000A60BA26|nr:hypothetical protein [Vibrio parahaemolyticus]EGQ7821215.1 hypothetical protein [Vibrio parahaemolyticus]EJC7187476.1 hypothetical protein [Vibrio parahaemolyticus]EJC7971278.1 hypothetical protein [Vibrio parahaemolyticus]EJG0454876.1 hypothetical protein [Vibrio parahaemolyticus]EJG0464275.1 hypothetical protein [Vibrio parahaemolyticus]